MIMPLSHQDFIDQLRQFVPNGAKWRMDSRTIEKGDVFVALPGERFDGKDFIQTALEAGASCVLCHDSTLSGEASCSDVEHRVYCQQDKNIWLVQGLSSHLGALAHLWFNRPSDQLVVVALTGTNGKTSCTQWLAQALRKLGNKVGAIGTLGVTTLNGVQQSGTLTTPDVLSMHHQLAAFVDQGADYVVIEASSIGLEQGRLDGVNIKWAGFLNLTHDHLDYHGDMQHYAEAKALLFKRPSLLGAAINQDDSYASIMVDTCRAPIVFFSIQNTQLPTQFTAQTYSEKINPKALIQAQLIKQQRNGLTFELTINEQNKLLSLPFFGQHNISNILCVASLLHLLGYQTSDIVLALEALMPVPGRMEPVLTKAKSPLVLIDYAHTPDALTHLLVTSRAMAQQRAGKLWCVFGCGGDRDITKRPMMGKVASELVDYCIVTSDNPRGESPELIIDQIMAGAKTAINKSLTSLDHIVDRALAIMRAVLDANINDVIVIAGKGHETGQDIKGIQYPFDDRQWAAAGLLLKQVLPFETDTRQINAGAVFIAIKGDQFDGHDYILQAKQNGAIAAVVSQADESIDFPQIALGDSRQALLKMAQAWRESFDIPIIGVTGSNGKTTTKEMIATILAHAFGEASRLATKGNLNNDLGVPLTLLQLRANHRVAVIELGMNHPGEMALIAQCAQPTIGLVLNAQREHQEFMGSVEAVAKENGSVFSFMPKNGVAVFPAADQYTPIWQSMLGRHQGYTFGYVESAQFSVTDLKATLVGGNSFIVHTPNGQVEVNLPVPGLHNVHNALAACACTWLAGINLQTMAQALNGFGAVKGRMQVHILPSNQTLIDDTYNANPDSVRAAIDVLASLPSPRMLVLGDMGEVGENTAAMHAEVGEYAREVGVDKLLTMGQDTRYSVDAFGLNAKRCETPEEVCAEILKHTPHSILVKGSRFMKMERVVHQLMTLNTMSNPHSITANEGEQHAL